MNPKEIRRALREPAKAVARARGLRPGLPNVNTSAGVGFIVFDYPEPHREDETLKGNELVRETGVMVMTVVTEEGTGDDDGTDAAWALAQAYPVAPATVHAGFSLRIRRACVIGPGFAYEGTWRTPVRVYYEAETA